MLVIPSLLSMAPLNEAPLLPYGDGEMPFRMISQLGYSMASLLGLSARVGQRLTSRWTIEEDQSKLQLPPKIIIDGDDTQEFIYRKVKASETLKFDASSSHSPDGEELQFKWFQYKEVDSVMPIVCLPK